MREIKFRGKVLIGGEWRKGDLNTRTNIITDKGGFYRYVDPETIGQFTGLHDKNGKEIYEGDIIKAFTGAVYEVVYSEDNAGFYASYLQRESISLSVETIRLLDFKVIGNVYDNRDLMKED